MAGVGLSNWGDHEFVPACPELLDLLTRCAKALGREKGSSAAHHAHRLKRLHYTYQRKSDLKTGRKLAMTVTTLDRLVTQAGLSPTELDDLPVLTSRQCIDAGIAEWRRGRERL